MAQNSHFLFIASFNYDLGHCFFNYSDDVASQHNLYRHPVTGRSCFFLGFYIKPQPNVGIYGRCKVVSFWGSTSNHNRKPCHKNNPSGVE